MSTLPIIPVFYATMSGNSEDLAKRTARQFELEGMASTAIDLAITEPDVLQQYAIALFIVSTWGDGDPPDDAVAFFEALDTGQKWRFPELKFAVLALGDTSYEHFCACGKQLEAALIKAGAEPILPRVDCDVDFDEPHAEWLNAIKEILATAA